MLKIPLDIIKCHSQPLRCNYVQDEPQDTIKALLWGCMINSPTTNGNTVVSHRLTRHVFFSAKIKSITYLYFSETHIRNSYLLEEAGGCRRTNDRNTSIVGQKMCGQCSNQCTLCRHSCTDITQ